MLNGKIDGGGTGSGNSSLFGFTSEEIATSIWLLDYKTHGKTSHVYKRSKVWASLMNSGAAINDENTAGAAVDYVVNNNGHLGKLIGNIEGIDDTIDWLQYETISDIGSNETIMNIVASNDTLFAAFSTSEKLKISFFGYCNNYPSVINNLKQRFQSKKVTNSSSYSGFCIFISGVSKYDWNVRSNYLNNNYYVEAKGGLSYLNLANSRPILFDGYISQSVGGKNQASYASPKNDTSYNINQIVRGITITPKTSTYVYTASYTETLTTVTAGGTITYIPL